MQEGTSGSARVRWPRQTTHTSPRGRARANPGAQPVPAAPSLSPLSPLSPAVKGFPGYCAKSQLTAPFALAELSPVPQRIAWKLLSILFHEIELTVICTYRKERSPLRQGKRPPELRNVNNSRKFKTFTHIRFIEEPVQTHLHMQRVGRQNTSWPVTSPIFYLKYALQ